MTGSSPNDTQSPRQQLSWMLASALAVFALSVTASFAPPPLKRLFLFACLFGAVSGFVLKWLRKELRVAIHTWTVIVCGVLTALGAINQSIVTYQQYSRAARDWSRNHATDEAAFRMLEKIAAQDPETAARYKEERRRRQPNFLDYLNQRTAGMGKLSRPWPIVIWIIELGLAIACSCWIFRLPSHLSALAVSTEPEKPTKP